MRGSVLKVVVGSTTYYVDDPRVSEGLKATVSAVVEDPTPDGPVTRLLRRDRLNLDRARDRERFAEAAGIGPDDLNAVRDRVLDFLAPGYAATDQPPPEVDAATQGAARALLEAPDLLDRVEWAVRGLGHAGDRRLPLLIFLVFVSRLLRRPLNLELTGPSAAGKSFVVMLVARLFPPTAVYALNGMSERLLAYTDADLRHRILIVQEAAALHRDGVGAALLRSVAWEGNVAYEFVEKIAEGLKARRLEKPGPTGFITTTTGRVEPELQTRVLTAHVPDDEATSRQIVLALAERAAGAALDEPDPAPWLEAQRWLAEDGDREVVVPFAGELAWRYDVALVRSRRDFTQLLGLVGAVALLHQRQRRRDARGRIVADERDYRAAYHLASPIFGAIAAEGATPTIRATVQAVIDLVPDGKAAPATVNQVAAKLGVHKSVASRRAAAALKGGWLVDEEERKGKPKRLRPGDPLPAERPALPDPDEVFVDPSRNRATGQPPPGCAQDDGKNEGCADGCGNPGEHNRADPAVTPVAKRLQPPAQPRTWPNDGQNGGVDGRGCAVAPRPERVCVECGEALPAGWAALYCAQHGGRSGAADPGIADGAWEEFVV